MTTAEELAQHVPDRLLELSPYLYEDSEMSGLKQYMSEIRTWINSEVGHVDDLLMLDVMAEIGVTIGRWYRHVLSQPDAGRPFAGRLFDDAQHHQGAQ
ncbi:hypothetical protein ACQI4L_26255 [Mycolicibacterium litorale]|uniref:hypothetical protein n=1 Tax=Mycolicibacterium litorale TaxID=758802 RepID=UPI003CEB3E86